MVGQTWSPREKNSGELRAASAGGRKVETIVSGKSRKASPSESQALLVRIFL